MADVFVQIHATPDETLALLTKFLDERRPILSTQESVWSAPSAQQQSQRPRRSQQLGQKLPPQREPKPPPERVGESGRLFLAMVLDLYSRFIVGWALSAVNDRQLVIRALEMALRRRCPESGLMHHSGRGSGLDPIR
jgi:transposase InsO family protein